MMFNEPVEVFCRELPPLTSLYVNVTLPLTVNAPPPALIRNPGVNVAAGVILTFPLIVKLPVLKFWMLEFLMMVILLLKAMSPVEALLIAGLPVPAPLNVKLPTDAGKFNGRN